MRLLVLDVDGTLQNSRHEISAATCRAVARVQAAGIRVMLATGRRYRDVLPVALQLGIDTPLVTASGALVKQPLDHATLFCAQFAPGVLVDVLKMIVARGREPILYTDSFAAGFDFHCRRPLQADSYEVSQAGMADGDDNGIGPGLSDYLKRNQALACAAPLVEQFPPSGVFAGFTMGTQSQMRDLEESLRTTWPSQLSLHTIRSPRYREWMCEIAPAGVTKWAGILHVAHEWGIEPAQICAAGDDVNDLPMIRGAGLGIAMGNAQTDVLAAADLIVHSHDEDGIVEIADLLLAGLSYPAPLAGTDRLNQ